MCNFQAGHLGGDLFDREWRSRIADGLAAAAAASLPWSTSATAIFVTAWFVVLVSAIEIASLRREIVSPAGGLPIVLVAIAAVGMSWSQASLSERFQGLEGFCKLLFIPFLLVQFRRSDRGWWVILWFLAASILLLLVSSALAWIPGLPWRGKPQMPGVPVKDYISQSGVFALCAFALLGHAVDVWRRQRRRAAFAMVFVAALFIANIAFVETGRTTLVTIAVLVPLFGFRQFGWSGIVAAGAIGCAVAGTLWMSSSYLRERVIHAVRRGAVVSIRGMHQPLRVFGSNFGRDRSISSPNRRLQAMEPDRSRCCSCRPRRVQRTCCLRHGQSSQPDIRRRDPTRLGRDHHAAGDVGCASESFPW